METTLSCKAARPFERFAARLQSMSTPPGNSDEDSGAEDDDLDDTLRRTGELTNSDSGKTGTDTEAEPQRKPFRDTPEP
jgi:hypothetical protein